MKRTVKYILLTLLFTAFLSCGNEVSLQRYFVEHQESKNFLTQDFPIDIVNVDQSDLTEEQREAYNSVKRLNFLGYKSKGENDMVYNKELDKVKAILNNDKYIDLIEISDKGRKIVVKYVGTDNEADEVIILGSSRALGFGVIRVLGDDMRPDKMAALVHNVKSSNFSEDQIKGIVDFFK